MPSKFPDDPEFEEPLRAQAVAASSIIDDVLDELLKDVHVLSKRIGHNFDQAPSVSQMMALTRLIDRIIKLDARKPRTGKPMVVTMRRVDKESDDKPHMPLWDTDDERY